MAQSETSSFTIIGKRVVDREAVALAALAESLDASFDAAIDCILNAKGRVIVCGMGKSGHVARKIAATLASTGTPAHFVHPAEASHGDLGMLAKGDVTLILSNSGETPELSDVIAHAKRFGIPMIGVAGRSNSTLLRQVDVALLLPPVEEACDTGIVPTTSTTMTLALGDALAIALMEHRDFTPENFRAFHPGGKLGARLSKVEDLMHIDDEVPVTHLDTTMSDVLLTMSQKGFGVVGVTDQKGHLRGIITDGDLRRNMVGLLDMSAADVMTEDPSTIARGELAESAVAVMNAHKITCLFVTASGNGGTPEGILHIHDCLRAGIA
ncbi:MAG: KpsF/GutQ family sugar-phosphate isomerase [Pseudomonadota bacterium]